MMEDIGRVSDDTGLGGADGHPSPSVSALTGAIPSADEVFGIECEHHYGITTHPLPKYGRSVGEEVYRLIREAWHRDLTDENHSFEVVQEPKGWSRVVIRKNANSPLFAFKPWWCDDGDGALWFSQPFRVATRSHIEAEIADRISLATQWQKQSDEQRDTIRGRKTRAHYSSLAEIARREAELIGSRWPQFSGSARTGWQNNLHQHRDPRRDSDGTATAAETPKSGSGPQQDCQARANGIAQPEQSHD